MKEENRTQARPAGNTARIRKAAGFFTVIGRIARRRLIVPVKRSRHPPEHAARGVFAGVFWAFTPLVGMQMPLTALTWLVSRTVFKRDFNLVIALAWNWVTNVFTVLPVYYVFYLTGQVMLGRWDDLSGYDSFTLVWSGVLHSDIPFREKLLSVLSEMARGQGLPLAVGWIPFAAVLPPLAYIWSLKLVQMHRRRMAAKAQKTAGA